MNQPLICQGVPYLKLIDCKPLPNNNSLLFLTGSKVIKSAKMGDKAGFLLGRRKNVGKITYHGNPQPSFLGGVTHILGMNTIIFHGFGVQGYI